MPGPPVPSSTNWNKCTADRLGPQDLGNYPEATTHVCAYSGHGPSVDALVGALFGESGFFGRLPVTIPVSRRLGT